MLDIRPGWWRAFKEVGRLMLPFLFPAPDVWTGTRPHAPLVLTGIDTAHTTTIPPSSLPSLPHHTHLPRLAPHQSFAPTPPSDNPPTQLLDRRYIAFVVEIGSCQGRVVGRDGLEDGAWGVELRDGGEEGESGGLDERGRWGGRGGEREVEEDEEEEERRV